MEFQKERCFTTLNADELKIGSKVIVAEDLSALKDFVLKHSLPKTIKEVESEDWGHRFLCDDGFHYPLAYLVEEPEEKKLKWTDLKLGDVITNGKRIAMVTEIDKERVPFFVHIFAGQAWLSDKELEKWEKVEE